MDYISVKLEEKKEKKITLLLDSNLAALPPCPCNMFSTFCVCISVCVSGSFTFTELSDPKGVTRRVDEQHWWVECASPLPWVLSAASRLNPGEMCPAQTLCLASGLGGETGSPTSEPNPSQATITRFQFQLLVRHHVSSTFLHIATDCVACGASGKTARCLRLCWGWKGCPSSLYCPFGTSACSLQGLLISNVCPGNDGRLSPLPRGVLVDAYSLLSRSKALACSVCQVPRCKHP